MRVHLFLFFVLLSFQLLAQKTGTFIDKRDDKSYKTVSIGNQIWMAENLNFDTTRSWCEKCEENGRIYQYKGALMAVPEGWHLPRLDEWIELFDFLGGKENAISKLTSWNVDPKIANEIGFNTKPAPYRSDDQKIYEGGQTITYASATSIEKDKMYWTIEIDCNKKTFTQYGRQWTFGVSVRCVKDYNEDYYPIDKKKATEFINSIDSKDRNIEIRNALNDLGDIFNKVGKKEIKNPDYGKIQEIYSSACKLDSNLLNELIKIKEVDTTLNILINYENYYKSQLKVLQQFNDIFKTFQINANDTKLGEMVNQLILFNDDLGVYRIKLEASIGYFRKKYKID